METRCGLQPQMLMLLKNGNLNHMNLYMIHVGFYDPDIMDGLYEQHTNYFVVAEDIKDAKQKAVINPTLIRSPLFF